MRGISKHEECTCLLELHNTSKIKLFISLLCVEEKCEVHKEHIPKGAVFSVFSKYVGITTDGQISECICKTFFKSVLP